jgi:hypothetical protein
MALYYAYLDAVEEEKRKAQRWECEVTVIAQPDDGAAPPASKPVADSKPAAKSAFVCDDPE